MVWSMVSVMAASSLPHQLERRIAIDERSEGVDGRARRQGEIALHGELEAVEIGLEDRRLLLVRERARTRSSSRRRPFRSATVPLASAFRTQAVYPRPATR